MKYFVSLLLLSVLFGSSNAQLVFTENEIMNTHGGNVTTYSDSTQLPGLVPLIALSGAAQTWDFSNQPFIQSNAQSGTQTVLAYPGGAAFASDPDFASATHVVKTVPNDPTLPTTYVFFRFDATGSWLLGSSEDSLGIPKKNFSYTPPYQEYKFPLTYQTAWSSKSSFNISGLPPGFTDTISDDDIVDGYGTLTTPAPKSSVECLRVNNKITYTSTFMGFSNSTSLYTFSWITKSFKSMVVTTDGNKSPYAATYASSEQGGSNDVLSAAENPLNIHISNNPASNRETQLSFTLKNSGNVQVSLMDALGNQVHLLQRGHVEAGQNIIPIDPTKLPSGSYFVRVNADGMTTIRKLIITK